jgi:hypothetical protein
MFTWLSLTAWYTSAAGKNNVWTIAALIAALAPLILVVTSFIAADKIEHA